MATKKKINKILLGLVAVLVISLTLFEYNKSDQEKIVSESEIAGDESSDTTKEIMNVDLDGNGQEESVKVITDEEDESPMNTTFEAYDLNGNKIAEMYPGIKIMWPMSQSFKVYNLKENEDKEFFSFNFIAGTHSSETMFFGLHKDQIIPICFKEQITEPDDCLFFSDAMDSLIVEDVNNDGYIDVVETGIERGPYIEELTEEDEHAIEENFSDLSDEDLEELKKIVTGGSNRTGRLIALQIYSYNGSIFEEVSEEKYNNMFTFLAEENERIVSRNKAALSSLEYIKLVREFWTGR
jgi:hypothetical protein